MFGGPWEGITDIALLTTRRLGLWCMHQNPLDVEDFLMESFPSHKHLRLFAENFVMTNDKYAKKPPDERGGPHGM